MCRLEDRAANWKIAPQTVPEFAAKGAGKEVRHDVDPLSTPLQRLEAGWIRMLPIQDQL